MAGLKVYEETNPPLAIFVLYEQQFIIVVTPRTHLDGCERVQRPSSGCRKNRRAIQAMRTTNNKTSKSRHGLFNFSRRQICRRAHT